MAYYDLGPADAAETLLLTHGEPSWSYLYRKMVPPLLAKGYRLVLFDQVGFGRSDKPTEEEDYSHARHIAWNEDLLIKHLDLHNVTGVFQDWGGLLGLRVVAAHPDRFRRLVIANTFLPVCDDSIFEVPEGFFQWKAFAKMSGLKGDGDAEDRIAKMMASSGTALRLGQGDVRNISDAEALAYAAPFPSDDYKAGARAFPELVPTAPSDPTGRPQPEQGAENRAAWEEVFSKFEKPVITAFGDQDNVMVGTDTFWHENCPGCAGQAHTMIEGAGHFVQDGGAEQLTQVVIDFIEANPAVRKEFIQPQRAGFSNAVAFTMPGTGVTQITVSGAVGTDPAGGAVPDDLGAQADNALASLKGTLAEAGASFADVVKINTYIVDLDDEKVATVGLAVHNAFKHLPREQRAASTWLGVTSLVEESLGVEIECTAVVPEARGKL